MSILEGSLSIVPRNSIGAITIQASIEEVLEDRMEVTDHPVQTGANITDHSYKVPAYIVLHCGWSDSSPLALLATLSQDISGGHVQGAGVSAGIYGQLLRLQQMRVPFDVVTSLRFYGNMLITNIRVRRDSKTFQALIAEITCREVIMVSLQTVSMAPITDQATPSSTMQTAPVGTQNPTGGTPAPGGAVPFPNWTGQ